MSHLEPNSHSEVTLALGPTDGNSALVGGGRYCLWKDAILRFKRKHESSEGSPELSQVKAGLLLGDCNVISQQEDR